MVDSNPSCKPEMRVRTVEMQTPDGMVRGKVSVTSGPMSLAGLAPTALALTGALVDRAVHLEINAGRTVSCRAGCGACCRYMVPLSPPEAFYLMDVIDAFEPARRSACLDRFDEIVRVLDEEGMIEELLDPPQTDRPALPIAKRYFALRLACPFLIDESCSIHAHRPVACRDYNVTSPAEWCGNPYQNDIAKVPMPLPLSVPLARLTASLTGRKACLIPLTLVPRWVSEHAEQRNLRWPGTELFDRFLVELRRDRDDSP